jgi:hypothetical protein
MNTWLTAGGGVILLAILIAIFRPRRRRADDMGVISDQWIAQHRAGPSDSYR